MIESNSDQFDCLKKWPRRQSLVECGQEVPSQRSDLTTAHGLVYSALCPIAASSLQITLELPGLQGTVSLNTLEIFPLKLTGVSFLLKSSYIVESVLPRSLFAVLYQLGITHNFVFKPQDPDSPFFQELAGMRQVIIF